MKKCGHGGAKAFRRAEPRSVSAACSRQVSGTVMAKPASEPEIILMVTCEHPHAAETLRGSALRVLPTLQALRPTLRKRTHEHFNPERVTRALEKAYEEMWARWCESFS